MNLYIYFAGTGVTLSKFGENAVYQYWVKPEELSENTMMMAIDGCQKPSVGGSNPARIIAPNLNYISEKINGLFTAEGQFPQDELPIRECLGDAIAVLKMPKKKGNGPYQFVDNLILGGFSRGAMTCFYLVKHMAQRALLIPTYIFANQPVPGNVTVSNGNLMGQVSNLSQCMAVKYCETILGLYDKNSNSMLQNVFFKQFSPLFSPNTEQVVTRLPLKGHLEGDELITFAARNFFFNKLFNYGIAILDSSLREGSYEHIRETFFKLYEGAVKKFPEDLQPLPGYQPNFDNFKLYYYNVFLILRGQKPTILGQSTAGCELCGEVGPSKKILLREKVKDRRLCDTCYMNILVYADQVEYF